MELRKYVFAVMASMGCAAFGAYLYSQYGVTSQATETVMTAPFEPNYTRLVAQNYAPTDFTEAAEKSVNAVVHVKILKEQHLRNGYSYGGGFNLDDPLLQFFFGPQQRRRQEMQSDNDGDDMAVVGAGSGVIISEDGYIVTNNHVIESADKIEVTLNDRTTFEANVIGTDPSTDIALLKIDADGLQYLQFGNSDAMRVGEWVLAIGNPLNLTSTVTAGIISAKGRNLGMIGESQKQGFRNQGNGVNKNQLTGIEAFIQTDAAVNPGNSGGALVNTRGELIGINTAIASPTGSYSGYSFAVPSTIAQKVVQDLKQYGEVQRALLGVSISDVSTDVQKKYNLKDTKGVLVAQVSDGSAAKEAGIEKGDVIVGINGEKVNTVPSLLEIIGTKRPGESVKIEVIREGKNKEFVVTLKNVKGTTSIVKIDEKDRTLGATLEKVSDEELGRLRIRNGMKIVKLSDGKLKESGVKEGFIIVKANRVAVASVKEFEQIVSASSEGLFISGIYPNGKVAYYAVNVEE